MAGNELAGGLGARLSVLAVVGLGALSMAPTCGVPVTVPAEDTTPPEVTLSFLVGDGKVESVPALGLHRALRPGDQVIFFAEGTDPNGIRRITVHAVSEMRCGADTRTEERREEVTHTETDHAGPGDTGNTARLTSVQVDGRFTCAPGFSPRSRRVTVLGAAENYHGGMSITPAAVFETELAHEPPMRPQR